MRAAAPPAAALIAGLVAIAPTLSDTDLEDELCVRFGPALWAADNGPVEDQADPALFGTATVAAVIEAATAATATGVPNAATVDPTAAWRVLAALARIVPEPLSRTAIDSMRELRGPTEAVSADPTLAGPVWWTRDGYGGRFGVVAPLTASDGPNRWYLWDIDTCGHRPVTVHSGYYDGPDRALAAWRDGVGSTAGDRSTLTAVDDPSLLATLLPDSENVLRTGGESPEQFAEYFRSRRLAEAVRLATTSDGGVMPADADMSAAIMEFLGWLPAHRAGQPLPTDFESLAIDVVGAWIHAGPAELFHACSPHRVALFVAHLREIHDAGTADDMVASLPDLISWLAQRNGTPPELARRCLRYLAGEPYPGTGNSGGLNFMARVSE